MANSELIQIYCYVNPADSMLEAIIALGPMGMSLRVDGDWEPVRRSDIEADLIKWYGGYRIYDIDFDKEEGGTIGEMEDDDDDWSEPTVVEMFDKGPVSEADILPYTILLQDENGENPNIQF